MGQCAGILTWRDREQNKVAKFVHHKNDSNWKTLVQCRKIAHICVLLKAYMGKWAWKALSN
jgi:hypothetical protein